MAKISTLTETWSSGINSNWSDVSNSQASVVSGQLNINSNLSLIQYNTVQSAVNYDLTSSSAFTQVVNAGNQGLASFECIFLAALDGNNKVYFTITGNTLYARKIVASTNTIVASTTYNTTQHRFLRLRESSGTTFFDTSPDALAWTNLTSLTNPFAMTALSFGLQVGTWQTESATGTAVFDNFNYSQRQFRLDDTSAWLDHFGNGQDGALSLGAGNLGGVAGCAFASIDTQQSAGATSVTFTDRSFFNGTSANGGRVGDLILIHQTQGTGSGNWELNKINSRSGSTIGLAYPLINTYNAGAQIVSSGQFTNITFTGGTMTPYLSWAGAAGGIMFLVASSIISVAGAASAAGYGFRGGSGGAIANTSTRPGWQGEGYTQAGSQTTVANGTGGGGGGGNTGGGNGGGGGGNHVSGAVSGSAGTSAGPGGTAGSAGTDLANLTILQFGGGGGGGAADDGSIGGNGGAGGGLVFLLGRQITVSGSVTAGGGTGGDGQVGPGSAAGGGGGAGGCVLLKAQKISLGTNLVTATGGNGGTGSAAFGTTGGNGGAGGTGRAHADYVVSPSGTTNPTLDTYFDPALVDGGGGFLLNFV